MQNTLQCIVDVNGAVSAIPSEAKPRNEKDCDNQNLQKDV